MLQSTFSLKPIIRLKYANEFILLAKFYKLKLNDIKLFEKTKACVF